MRSGRIIRQQSYFQKNLLTLLVISALPALVIGLALDAFYSQALLNVLIDDAQNVTEQISDRFLRTADEYADVVENLASNPDVASFILSGQGLDPALNAMNAQLFMRRQNIVVHLIPFGNRSGLSSGYRPNLYRFSVYKSAYIFARLSLHPRDLVIMPIRYKDGAGDTISLALAKQIWLNGEAIGCVIVDVRRSALESSVALANKSSRHYSVINDDGTVILDTRNNQREGLRLEKAYNETLLSNQDQERLQDLTVEKHSLWTGAPDGFYVRSIVNVSVIDSANAWMRLLLALMLPATLGICILVSIRMSHRVGRPVKQVCQALKSLKNGDMNVRLDLQQDIIELTELEQGFNQLVERLETSIAEKIQDGQLLRQAELTALQAQINPHFINNTLSAVRSLARIHRQDEILSIVDNLSILMHANIDCPQETVTVREDIKLIEHYLKIQNIRFEDKFCLENRVKPEYMDCMIPRMILQTVVENAVKHGLEGMIGKGHIVMNASAEAGCLQITIADDGLGMSQERLEEVRLHLYSNLAVYDSIGLWNANRRLKLHFGEKSGLLIDSREGYGTTVIVRLSEQHENR